MFLDILSIFCSVFFSFLWAVVSVRIWELRQGDAAPPFPDTEFNSLDSHEVSNSQKMWLHQQSPLVWIQ